ncbi:sigma factor-like helix-turn-helix DNA-binding protein [Micromonospora sp. KC213]|uniref:RNA polymerase sigma factor n=1 Tax=Micromonospora sp. KC213 TaxID=2530378 RepID=UPI001404D5C2|nr:sigma factor-like helix-turn-helix DNA-binding protein [Micromonospora sp. KC213]
MTAVRVFSGYTRAGFAATLGCTAGAVRAYERCVKPDGGILHTLVRRHTTPGSGTRTSPHSSARCGRHSRTAGCGTCSRSSASTNAELAARLGVPARILDKGVQAWQATTPVSINIPHQRDGQPMAATLPARPQSEPAELETANLVRELLGPLHPEQRRLIELRYLHEADIHEIAQRVGSPPEEVEIRLAGALEHLRHQARHVYDA